MLLVGVIFVTTSGAFQNLSLSENILGNLLIVGACFFWGIDNNLSKFLSRKRDIILVTGLKCFIGGLALLGLSFLLGFSFAIPLISIPYILFVGAFSIAFSILFFLFALRKIGSMRTGVIFSLSSLFGAALCFCCPRRSIHSYSADCWVNYARGNLRSLSLWKTKIAFPKCSCCNVQSTENLCSYSLLGNRRTFGFRIDCMGHIPRCRARPFFLYGPDSLLSEERVKNRYRLWGKILICGFLCCILTSISPSRCFQGFPAFLQR